MKTEIGNRIAQIRGDRSQAAFADELGVHKNTVGNYERGRNNPDADFLAKLAGIGVNTHWVITGEGPIYLDDMAKDKAGTISRHIDPSTAPMHHYRHIDKNLFNDIIQLVRSKESQLKDVETRYLIDTFIDIYNKAIEQQDSQIRELIIKLDINERSQAGLRESTRVISNFMQEHEDNEAISSAAKEQIGKNKRLLNELRAEAWTLKSQLKSH